MSGLFTDFRPTDTAGAVQDDSAVAVTIATDQVNAIRDLVSARGLLAFTLGGEFAITGANPSEAITPTNIKAVRQTKHGSANVAPLGIGNSVLFLQRQGRRLREMSFSFEADSFVAPDMSLLADNVMGGGILAMAYQQEPHSLIWAARADGELLGFTYQRDQEVTAWHDHPLGGAGCVVESVDCIPGASGQDELWLAVKRTINGATARHVEVLEDFPAAATAAADMPYADDGLSYGGAAVSALTGLWHLNGETVSVLADGAIHPDVAVSNGAIALERAAAKIHVGLHKRAIILPQRPNTGAMQGTAQAQQKRVDTVWARVYNSGAFKCGQSLAAADLQQVDMRTADHSMDTAVPLRTGDVKIPFGGKFTTDGDIYIVQDLPLPLNLLGIIARITTQEGM